MLSSVLDAGARNRLKVPTCYSLEKRNFLLDTKGTSRYANTQMRNKSPSNKGKTYSAEPLTSEEAQRLIDQVKGNGPLAVRNRALIALLWRSGLRISEALSLKPSDLDLNAGIVRVREGKGRKPRVAVIDGLALGYLTAWLAVRTNKLGLNGRQPLFCSVASGATRKPGDPLATSYVRRLLPKLGEQAGIDKRVHAHGLRHTMATEMVERGIALHVIAGQLGHSSTATTDTYLAKLMPDERIKAMRAAGWEMEQSV